MVNVSKRNFKRGILTWRETNRKKQGYKATEGEHMWRNNSRNRCEREAQTDIKVGPI
jgi:hypothetical protein